MHGLHRGYIGIMETKKEMTIEGLGLFERLFYPLQNR